MKVEYNNIQWCCNRHAAQKELQIFPQENQHYAKLELFLIRECDGNWEKVRLWDTVIVFPCIFPLVEAALFQIFIEVRALYFACGSLCGSCQILSKFWVLCFIALSPAPASWQEDQQQNTTCSGRRLGRQSSNVYFSHTQKSPPISLQPLTGGLLSCIWPLNMEVIGDNITANNFWWFSWYMDYAKWYSEGWGNKHWETLL